MLKKWYNRKEERINQIIITQKRKGILMTKGMKYEQLIPEWVQLYNEGKSFREIAEQYGCNKNTVGRTLREHVEQRPKSEWDKYAEEWANLYMNHMYSKTDIANQFGTKIGVVSRVLKAVGIAPDAEVSLRLKKYTHLVGDFIREYESGMSLHDIERKHGVNKQTVLNYLRDEGVELRDYAESSRKYSIKEDYFDVIDTEEKAYFLGLVFAIGTTIELFNSHCLNLSIHESKEILIKNVVKELRGEEEYGGISKNESDDVLRVRLHSKKLYDKLRELGLKSRTETTFPNIPSAFDTSFILGYIEDRASYNSDRGDLMIYGNKLFLEQLYEKITQVVV